MTPDYNCFVVPDEFVVGYGLDYDEVFRNYPHIAVLKPEILPRVIFINKYTIRS